MQTTICPDSWWMQPQDFIDDSADKCELSHMLVPQFASWTNDRSNFRRQLFL